MSKLNKFLSSKALHSIFIRKSDGAILVSECGNMYFIDGDTYSNVSYRELKISAYYTELTLKMAKHLTRENENVKT